MLVANYNRKPLVILLCMPTKQGSTIRTVIQETKTLYELLLLRGKNALASLTAFLIFKEIDRSRRGPEEP